MPTIALPNEPLWGDQAPPTFGALAGTHQADACVVGLGGSGLAAVHALLDRGLRVIALDAGPVAAGAAGRNGGLLLAGIAEFHHDAVARFGHARAVRLYRKTLDELPRLAAATPDCILWPGSLRIAATPDEEDDCRAHLAQLRADGFNAEWYDGPEGRGILVPTDGVCQPVQRCRALAASAAARGAKLFEHSPVTHLAPGRVTTTGGVVACDRIIVAVDGRMLELFPELSGRARTVRLQMLGTAPDHSVVLPRPVSYRYAFDYWQQLPDGRVVIGGGRDRFEQSAETADDRPSDDVQAYLESRLREHLGVRAPITHRWAASVCYTPDYLPLMLEPRPGIWALGAYSGTGNVVGAICARAVVDAAIDGDRRGIDDWYVP